MPTGDKYRSQGNYEYVPAAELPGKDNGSSSPAIRLNITEQAKKVPPYGVATEQLHRALCQLLVVCDQLTEKLEPMLTPAQPTKCEGEVEKEREAYSKITLNITSTAYTIDSVTKKLTSLCNRVEI